MSGALEGRARASIDPCAEDEVFRKELEEVAVRRQAAQVTDTRAQAPDSLIGVSLSGGGVRAASVGLGFLQALYERNLLRYVDYLSTVSGGTYVGAFFTSIVNHDSARLDRLTADG